MRDRAVERVALMVVSLLVAPVLLVWGGFAVMMLWGWFVVPLGVPEVGLAHAIGLAILGRYLGKNFERDKARSPEEQFGETVATGLLAPGFVLLFGWVIHLFM